MIGPAEILVSILGLAILMIVHEGGHMLVARAFGMRVTTFSIGFGPTFFKIEPEDGYFWFKSFGGKVRLRLGAHNPEKHGPTVYQVGMIPFLAYVQIAGMNPFEDHDPEDKGSYANAGVVARICTIAAGPAANYFFASVLFFAAFFQYGVIEHAPPETRGTVINVMTNYPAAEAGLQDGDAIVEVNGTKVDKWTEMAKIISSHPEEPIQVAVERAGERHVFTATPRKRAEDGRGLLGVSPRGVRKAVAFGEAVTLSLKAPPAVVKNVVVGISRALTGKEKAEVGGPVMMVKEGAKAFSRGVPSWLELLGALSAYLGAFNLVPFPALDGGRLIFLGYELATRRRPDARVEAHVHVVGLMMLLGIMLWVTIFGQNDLNLGGK